MNPKYAFVALRAGHRCEYCHAPEVVFNSLFEVEHIGATVDKLGMNTPAQREARRLWNALGLFP
jgi:hypothetical protein